MDNLCPVTKTDAQANPWRLSQRMNPAGSFSPYLVGHSDMMVPAFYNTLGNLHFDRLGRVIGDHPENDTGPRHHRTANVSALAGGNGRANVLTGAATPVVFKLVCVSSANWSGNKSVTTECALSLYPSIGPTIKTVKLLAAPTLGRQLRRP
jgi:hypothetical protein